MINQELLQSTNNSKKFFVTDIDITQYIPHTLSLYQGTMAELTYVHQKRIDINEKSFNIVFDLEGDIEGQIICSLLDTPNPSQFIHGLFVETSNILIGQILTLLDKEKDCFINLSAPKRIEQYEKENELFARYITAEYQLNYKEEVLLFNMYFSYKVNI